MEKKLHNWMGGFCTRTSNNGCIQGEYNWSHDGVGKFCERHGQLPRTCNVPWNVNLSGNQTLKLPVWMGPGCGDCQGHWHPDLHVQPGIWGRHPPTLGSLHKLDPVELIPRHNGKWLRCQTGSYQSDLAGKMVLKAPDKRMAKHSHNWLLMNYGRISGGHGFWGEIISLVK